MPSVDFLRPRLDGARFKNGGIPKDVLPNLHALQEMVIEVARWQYLKDNPNRRRSSPDFSKVDLELVSIESGSTVPVFKLTTTQQTLDGQILHQKYFESAKEYIVETIKHLAQDEQLPPDEVPSYDMLEHLKHIGHNLRDDETLELTASTHQTPARLTKKIRDKVLSLTSTIRRASEVVLRGSVHKIDQKNMTFSLQQVYGPLVTGHLPDPYYDIIMKAFDRYKDNARVQIQGTVQHSRDGRISIESITHIHLLDKLDVLVQLDELRTMKTGWLNGEGVAPSHDGLDWLSDIFKQYYPNNVVLPHIYPTPKGDLDLEWSIGKREISLEVDLVKHSGEWSWYDVSTNSSDETVLDLNKQDSWEWVANQIRSMKEMLK